ncbi:stomatin-like protein [Thermoplasma volcanium GSS1]|uniref:Stomatin-like protein n=1 Tax=Thermoplasma volcanium (strain ATCC 51530 / DSM 4299 / JCM 9571 / NBRC 15438 / GSS1) TaxID=273116 RepID=Q97BY7_THEVO|nr:SPFH domain-containing protein [Thermoplasma volcanium]BAB59460.1 stomatin-like protein [Thermoplasma volcanium GSS1]
MTGLDILLIIIIIIALIILLSGIHVLKEWERAIVLTLGRYGGIRGPGIIFITPIVSRGIYVSTRIQPVQFKTEATFTKDNVPVNVDAIMYYQVIDPQKAVLNIENYSVGTNYAAQTTLREVIGKSMFDELLSEREKVGETAREIIDQKTEAWGVKVASVEIRDVIVPSQLQEAMSRQASAERERRSRVTLAQAEVEAAQKMVEASKQYVDNPVGLQLRWMQIIYEIGLEGKSSMIMVPSDVPVAGSAFSVMGMNEALKARGHVEDVQGQGSQKQ